MIRELVSPENGGWGDYFYEGCSVDADVVFEEEGVHRLSVLFRLADEAKSRYCDYDE